MAVDRQQALIERLLGEAEQAVVAEDWIVVSARARSIVALDPDHPEGAALLAAARRGDAAGPSTSAMESVPDDADSDEDWSAVLGQALQRARSDRDDPDAWLLAAEAALEVDDHSTAQRALHEVLRLDRGSVHGLLLSAELALAEDDEARADQLARQVLALQPGHEGAAAILAGISRPELAARGRGQRTVGCLVMALVATVLVGVCGYQAARVVYQASTVLGRTELCVLAHSAVSAQLRSPSTAEFPDAFCTGITLTELQSARGERVWRVAGPVDAQNGFGAMIRHHYVVEITDNGLGLASPARVLSITPVQ